MDAIFMCFMPYIHKKHMFNIEHICVLFLLIQNTHVFYAWKFLKQIQIFFNFLKDYFNFFKISEQIHS